MADDEEIYDDCSAESSKTVAPMSAKELMAKFEASGFKPAVCLKPTVTSKPAVAPKWGGGPGLNLAGGGAQTASPAKTANNAVNGAIPNSVTNREKSSEEQGGPKRRSIVEDRLAAFQNKGTPTPADKPKPGMNPPVAPKFKASDQNNNPNAAGPRQFGFKHNKPDSIQDIAKKPSVLTGSSFEKDTPNHSSPHSPRGVNLFGAANGPVVSPMDLKAHLKPVNRNKPFIGHKPSEIKDEVALRLNDKKSKQSRHSLHKSVIRNIDGKKFHRAELTSSDDFGPAPEKPSKLEEEIDLADMITHFEQSVKSMDMNIKDHGWTEVEEMYDDCGNVVKPVSSRAVSLMGHRPKAKPRNSVSKKVLPIVPLSEDDEMRWSDAGFPGLPESPNKAADIPADHDEGPQEEYSEVEVKPIEEEPEADELYEALPEEDMIEPEEPPPPRPEPPAPPSTPHPRGHLSTPSESSQSDIPETNQSETPKDPKEIERERKEREKEEERLRKEKEKEEKRKEKERKEAEKKMKKLAKELNVKLEVLSLCVGKGRIKATATPKKKKGGEIAVNEGDTVDIIRMVDNPSGKCLIRITTTMKTKGAEPTELIGYCDEGNIEFMKTSDSSASVPGPADGPQETYEDVDGQAEDEPIADEIYEECN
ncbi:FYN-binding protein 1-like isoform X4 [Mya arenaria]|uniref:FYN-binding protein 1-like isoform X4 n=1 Tax=Mya arenaria TaxID=6604 RepID=UPI0022DF4FDA|nr:FYN-binding protein 1-like isoform X4 [Mya arenaria]